jgi:hypothetical protein
MDGVVGESEGGAEHLGPTLATASLSRGSDRSCDLGDRRRGLAAARRAKAGVAQMVTKAATVRCKAASGLFPRPLIVFGASDRGRQERASLTPEAFTAALRLASGDVALGASARDCHQIFAVVRFSPTRAEPKATLRV